MLNPLRASLNQAGLAARNQSSPFAERAEAEVASFRALRSDLERQVRRGDMTVKVARERAAAAAEGAKVALKQQAEGFSPTPRAFLDRLVEATEARKSARENASLESLQRETNRLLRQSVTEMQLVARAREFEAQTFVRQIIGGTPAPTLDSLLNLARSSRDGGDDVAFEWSRRQLEAFRSQVVDQDEQRRIDLATERPEVVNSRLVESYLKTLEGQPTEVLTTFIDRSIEAGDANACVAAFVLARQLAPDGIDPIAATASRKVLSSLSRFPDAALSTLRGWEADARRLDAEAAVAQVTFAAARLDSESRLPGLETPTAAAVERLHRVEARPLARPGEPIGLTLSRRGMMPGDPDPAAGLESDIEVEPNHDDLESAT